MLNRLVDCINIFGKYSSIKPGFNSCLHGHRRSGNISGLASLLRLRLLSRVVSFIPTGDNTKREQVGVQKHVGISIIIPAGACLAARWRSGRRRSPRAGARRPSCRRPPSATCPTTAPCSASRTRRGSARIRLLITWVSVSISLLTLEIWNLAC